MNERVVLAFDAEIESAPLLSAVAQELLQRNAERIGARLVASDVCLHGHGHFRLAREENVLCAAPRILGVAVNAAFAFSIDR